MLPQQFSVNANAASATTLVSSASSVYPGASVTLTATVSASGVTPAGAVTFYDATTALGSIQVGAGGTAQFTATLPIGTHTLTASFVPAATSPTLASSSSPVTVAVVLPPDFTLAATPDALNVQRGRSGSASVLLTPVNGFDAAVTLGCGDLPLATTCTITGPSVAADGTWDYTVTVSPAKTVAEAATPGPRLPLAVAGLFGLLAFRRRSRRWLAAIAAICLLGGLSACTASYVAKPVTDTVTITATAATGQTHSAQFSLTVD